jgi:uncharacterized membrane protein YphA (DoxX/SURF4 family)
MHSSSPCQAARPVDTAVLTARLVLAAVLFTAALAKFADRSGSRRAVADFGLPTVLVEPLALAVPILELATALALLPDPSARWAAVAAGVLLASFTAVIAVNLARGRRPPCHCFGQMRAAPLDRSMLVRNLLLLGAAAFAAWKG